MHQCVLSDEKLSSRENNKRLTYGIHNLLTARNLKGGGDGGEKEQLEKLSAPAREKVKFKADQKSSI